MKCKPYSEITVEIGTQLKTVKITSNIFAVYCEKKCCIIFETSRTIYSNSERSERSSVKEFFFNLRFLRSNKLRTIGIQIGKVYWDLEIICR